MSFTTFQKQTFGIFVILISPETPGLSQPGFKNDILAKTPQFCVLTQTLLALG